MGFFSAWLFVVTALSSLLSETNPGYFTNVQNPRGSMKINSVYQAVRVKGGKGWKNINREKNFFLIFTKDKGNSKNDLAKSNCPNFPVKKLYEPSKYLHS